MVLLILNIWQEYRIRLWVSLGFFFPIFTLCFLCWPSAIPESNCHIQTEFFIFQETTFLVNCISHLSFLLFLFCHVSVERPHHKKSKLHSLPVFELPQHLGGTSCCISWMDRLKKSKMLMFLAFFITCPWYRKKLWSKNVNYNLYGIVTAGFLNPCTVSKVTGHWRDKGKQKSYFMSPGFCELMIQLWWSSVLKILLKQWNILADYHRPLHWFSL